MRNHFDAVSFDCADSRNCSCASSESSQPPKHEREPGSIRRKRKPIAEASFQTTSAFARKGLWFGAGKRELHGHDTFGCGTSKMSKSKPVFAHIEDLPRECYSGLALLEHIYRAGKQDWFLSNCESRITPESCSTSTMRSLPTLI